MSESDAYFRADGSCGLNDPVLEIDVTWASVGEWAEALLTDWRTKGYDAPSEFISTACRDAVPGVVDALVVLAETAVGEEELARVGAGPLEDLVAHYGNGLAVLAEVDRAARQSAAFRAALSCTWLTSAVPAPVRDRLAQLGALVIDGS